MSSKMKAYNSNSCLPHLWVKYQISQTASTFFFSDWSSEGLDAVLSMRLLESLPENLWYSSFHSQHKFVGRLVSVGKVENSNLFSASLIRNAHGVVSCNENPFFSLSGLNADVFLEDQNFGKSLILKVFIRRIDCEYHD
jgi:hypothetical protein